MNDTSVYRINSYDPSKPLMFEPAQVRLLVSLDRLQTLLIDELNHLEILGKSGGQEMEKSICAIHTSLEKLRNSMISIARSIEKQNHTINRT